MTEKKGTYERLKDAGLIGFMKTECHIYGCNDLETTCKDCGKVVNTAQFGANNCTAVQSGDRTEETALEIAKQAYKEINFVIKHWENMEGLGISFCWDRCIAVDGYLFHSHQLEEN